MSSAFSVNNRQMNAEQIFNILDSQDGKDGKINSKTWNIFAVASGQQGRCKNYMEHDNAIKRISEYLSGARDKVETYINSLCTQNGTSAVSAAGSKAKTTATNEPAITQADDATKTTKSEPKKHDHYQPKMSEAEVKEKYPEVYVMVEAVAKKYNNKNADIAYWTELIGTLSKKYKVEPEVLVAIIGREVRFNENPEQVTGSSGGPMQATQSTISDFWPGTWRNKYYWSKVDSELLNEILYDENGKQRYKTPKDLWKACKNDHEYGMKVGILIYKAKEVKAMARMKKCDQFDVITKMQQLKANMSDEERTKFQKIAFGAYNGGGTNGYAADAQDSYLKCKSV